LSATPKAVFLQTAAGECQRNSLTSEPGSQVSRPSVQFSGVSAEYIAELYHRYLREPGSVDESWKPYFEEFFGRAPLGGNGLAPLEVAAANLVQAYRQRGHFAARLDPLGLWSPRQPSELAPAVQGADPDDLDVELAMPGLPDFAGPRTIRRLVEWLKQSYTGTIGFDIAHVDQPEARIWLQDVAESGAFVPEREARRSAGQRILEADEFEQFLNRRFIGKKRFGAEGAEGMVAWFDALFGHCAGLGVEDAIIGGTARGRLNVMANIVGKPLAAMLYELKGHRPFPQDVQLSGDVTYHLGYSSDRSYGARHIRLTYCHNPSHLEAIDGVVLGRVRARQEAFDNPEEGRRRVLCVQVHTDAAFAGQGVVAEILQLSRLPHYSGGGSIHFVINNQVGFTTDPANGRSSTFCTDVARSVGAPVLHVNGDDIDAVIRTAAIAAAYRSRFGGDIVIDFVCYRRRGHNEVDEPSFTQPQMYRAIAGHPPVRETYLAKLQGEDILPAGEIERLSRAYFDRLDTAYKAIESYRPNRAGWAAEPDAPAAAVSALRSSADDTGVAIESLRKIGQQLGSFPDGFSVHAKVARQIAERSETIESGREIAWATGEALAFATLAAEGIAVRFSGQDSPRGAFSQRHFHLVDQNSGETYLPFAHVAEGQARCEIIGSPLSEYSLLAFEYGYAMDAVRSLVVWEAQFGDFANVAQVVIDQFVTSGEDKWAQHSGLTLMLPHGLEGQGPDHSSGRIERFLQMCAGGNITVANCTTPANLFHFLRRQARNAVRRPAVLFTPKSLLRHRRAVSELADFAAGSRFRPVIGSGAARAERVVLCSGKIYYDLVAACEEVGAPAAIVRLEQLYPFPRDALTRELAKYPQADVLWCQEEPENMGAWSYLDRKIEDVLRAGGHRCAWPRVVSRPENASTAIGTTAEHDADQIALVRNALGIGDAGAATQAGRRDSRHQQK
jgi:2-oxoglutarate dehydrogenase E1 component